MWESHASLRDKQATYVLAADTHADEQPHYTAIDLSDQLCCVRTLAWHVRPLLGAATVACRRSPRPRPLARRGLYVKHVASQRLHPVLLVDSFLLLPYMMQTQRTEFAPLVLRGRSVGAGARGGAARRLQHAPVHARGAAGW